ncbi:UDP-glucose/GDP-mannose dehydrogenase family protein [Actinacidiphila oryziradicis]|uniref:UDP-glucose 6-dehydrogenase n=1 Tax=Actinacidiphila oryziradicis TaxID=2571141 RepID=A0A4U0SMY9_9ACTN|nr:UDP-glucose/GDP-mannose dehydrogenase family protein [Actinacidiphila oryziradicis]
MTVIGCGYLGATHATCMAELGHEVLGLDTDPEKTAALAEGRPPFYEPDLAEMLDRNTRSGRLRFTSSYAEAAEFGQLHFLAVGTPQRPDGAADLRQLESAVSLLAPHLRRPCVLVGKSTVPVGTAALLTTTLRGLAPVGARASLAWSPEFLREGHAVEDTLRPDRLVFGRSDGDGRSLAALREVYVALITAGIPVVETDLATAELIKTAANSFLATKISFINAMAEVCEAAGGDVWQLAEALAYDSRIGGQFLRPGLGFGGGCLPKDIRGFVARAHELGAGRALGFLREVDGVNDRRRVRMVELAERACGGALAGRRIGVWGAAFKPGTDDIRDSPALAVAVALRERGADVVVYDPRAMDNARKAFPYLEYADSAAAAAGGTDALLHLTEWQEFGEVDPAGLADRVRAPRLIDGRSGLDLDRWRRAGWTCDVLGHGPVEVDRSESRIPDATS